jgi:hypothetical protein
VTASFFGCFVVGLVTQCRRHLSRVALFALPFLLTFLAAVLRRYPYGMSVRAVQHLVPATLVLAAAGAAWSSAQPRRLPLFRWVIPGLAAVLVGLGCWRVGQDLGHPYRTPWDRTSREFARWFWGELAADAELVCVRTDLGIALRPGRWAYDGTDQYLCLQRIYSPRHQQDRPPRWDKISATRPLRCVLLNQMPGEVPAFRDWVETHRDRFRLREVRTYPATRGSESEPAQTYVVCEFVPTALAAETSAHPHSIR